MVEKVVITGMGTVNPVGLTVDEYWEGLTAGRSGIATGTKSTTTTATGEPTPSPNTR